MVGTCTSRLDNNCQRQGLRVRVRLDRNILVNTIIGENKITGSEVKNYFSV